jgi:RNA methyltransferase, TrmH family
MLSKAELKRLQALGSRRKRAETGLFLAEGVRVAEDLLASAVVPDLAVVSSSLEDTPRGAALASALRGRVRTEVVPDHVLAGLADTDAPQGVVVVAEIPRPDPGSLQLAERTFGLVLDAVQDPGNFGTIVRSADAFGAAFVAVLPGSVDPWNGKAVRSAAGSSMRVPILELPFVELLTFLRERGFVLFGAAMDGVSAEGLPVPARAALALGNEGAGLSATVREACDSLVAIPIRGAAESLNVGVAAGILCYLLTRELS